MPSPVLPFFCSPHPLIASFPQSFPSPSPWSELPGHEPLPNIAPDWHNPHPSSLTVPSTQVRRQLEGLNQQKAGGLDCISPVLGSSLLFLSISSISVERLPLPWKSNCLISMPQKWTPSSLCYVQWASPLIGWRYWGARCLTACGCGWDHPRILYNLHTGSIWAWFILVTHTSYCENWIECLQQHQHPASFIGWEAAVDGGWLVHRIPDG